MDDDQKPVEQVFDRFRGESAVSGPEAEADMDLYSENIGLGLVAHEPTRTRAQAARDFWAANHVALRWIQQKTKKRAARKAQRAARKITARNRK